MSTCPNQQWITYCRANPNRHGEIGEELTRRHGKITKQSNDSITQTLRATLSTITNDKNTRFTKAEAQIEDNRRQAEANTNILEALQTRIDARECNNSSSSSGGHKRNDQNSVRATATGFTELSLEKEVRDFFLQKVLKAHATDKGFEDFYCPAKPITRNEFFRLAYIQQYTIDDRDIRFKPDLNTGERY